MTRMLQFLEKLSETPLCNVTVCNANKELLLTAPLYYKPNKGKYLIIFKDKEYVHMEDWLWDELQWKVEILEHIPEDMQKLISVNGVTLEDVQYYTMVRNNFNWKSMLFRSMDTERLRIADGQITK